MAVDLHTSATHDSSFPYDSLLPPSTDFTHSNNFIFNASDSNPHSLISRQIRSHTSTTTPTSLPPQLTQQQQHMVMSLQPDHNFGSSCIASEDLDSLNPLETCSWSQQSSLWSPLYSSQGSPEGSLSPSEPASIHDSDCYDMVKMLEKMKLEENGSSKFKSDSQQHPGVGSSHAYILNEQIRANQLSRLRQEQILSLKQKLIAYRENQSYVSSPQFQKNGKGMTHSQPSGSLNRRTGSEKFPHFQEATGSRGPSCGTGVFLPRGGVSTMFPSQSKRPGKGCSTVLIPERVVQALQLHFEQIAATSGPKPRAIPPLHDVLVSTNRDGMYSLQKRQSRKKPTQVQNEMILPREWTY